MSNGWTNYCARILGGLKRPRSKPHVRTSKYMPHQGEREMARRRRQRERGIIK